MDKDLRKYLTSGRCSLGKYLIIKTTRTTPYTDEEIGEANVDRKGVNTAWYFDFDFHDAAILYKPEEKLNFCLAMNAFTLIDSNSNVIPDLCNIKKKIYPEIKKIEIDEETLLRTNFSQADTVRFYAALNCLGITQEDLITNSNFIIVVNTDRYFNELLNNNLINIDFIEDIDDLADVEYERKYF